MIKSSSARSLSLCIAAISLFLLGVGGCINENAPSDPEQAEDGAAFAASGDRLYTELEFADDGETTSWLAVTPPFSRVGLRFDADAAVFIEARVRESADSQPDAWVPLTVTYEDGIAKNAHADVTQDGFFVQLRFRQPVEAGLSFVAVEVFEPAHDNDGLDVAENEERGALSGESYVVSRSAWGARSRNCGSSHSPNRITIHHTYTPTNDSMSVAARVRQIQAFHIDNRGWCDIGYHFLVGQDGNVYQGRYENRTAAHAAGANRNNVGVSFVGNFTSVLPNNDQWAAGAQIVRDLANTWGVAKNRNKIKGHRQVGTTSTSCPGDLFYTQLNTFVSDVASGETTIEPPPPAGCDSMTLGASVDHGDKVQVPYSACGLSSCAWYQCRSGSWVCDDGTDEAGNEWVYGTCATDEPEPNPEPEDEPEPEGEPEPEPVTTGSYSDVPSDHPAFSAAEALREVGALWGCAVGQFCPDEAIIRAQLAHVIAVAEVSGVTTPTSAYFSDVNASHWAYDSVQELRAREITWGCGGGQFCPDGEVTRAEAAVYLARAFDPPSSTSSDFADVPATHWAASIIARVADAGLMGGCGNGDFCPGAILSRADAAVIFASAYNLMD